jgi:hypothetical protein
MDIARLVSQLGTRVEADRKSAEQALIRAGDPAVGPESSVN